MRYGLPYKGSKNAIADWIVSTLPKAETFVDLFCGGGAVTHCAMLRRKYEKFIMNDIDGRLPILFKDCAYGKYTTETHPEWISREEFHQRKADDAYIALVWSFGNNGKDYLYGEDIEPFKHAYHRLVFENDPEPIKQFGYDIKLYHSDNIINRYYHYKSQIRRQTTDRRFGAYPFDLDSTTRQIEIERLQRLQRLQSLQSLQILQSLQSLQRLQSLQSLESLQRLQSLQSDYKDVKIPDKALIYCDIPYANTNCGKYDGFDHAEFYKWALEQDNIFISEYKMPEPFIEIASTQKSILSTANGDGGKATEKIYTNPRTFARYDGRVCDVQLSFF